MALSEADVQAALARVVDPNTGKDFVAAKAVKKIAVSDGGVAVELALGYPARSQHESLRRIVQDAVGALPGVGARQRRASARGSSRTPCSAA